MNIIIQCGDHLENKQRILPLAVHLRKQGYNPIVLVYKKKSETFFLHNGIDSISIENFQPSSKFMVLVEKVLFKLNLNNTNYKGISFNDVFSTEILRGHKLNTHSKRQIIKHIKTLNLIFRLINPITVFIWNGYTGICANTLRIMCGNLKINSFYMERSLLKNGVYFDQLGVNGNSFLCNKVTKKELLNANLVQQNSIDIQFRSNVITNKLKQKWKKIIFIPLQVQNDTNIILFSPNIKSMRELVVNILNSVSEDVLLVIRHHPEEVEKKLNLPNANNILYSNEETLNHWIKLSDLVVTINSTVGFEALITGCPVMAFGKSIYTGKGLCTEVSDLKKLPKIFSSNDVYSPPNKKLVTKFARYLVYNHTALPGVRNRTIIKSFPKVASKNSGFFNCYNVDPTFIEKKALSINLVDEINTKKTIMKVGVALNYTDTLNMTYRKTKVEYTREYLISRLNVIFSTNKIRNIKLVSANDLEANVDVLILSRDKKINLKNTDLLVLDKYLYLHPSHYQYLK